MATHVSIFAWKIPWAEECLHLLYCNLGLKELYPVHPQHLDSVYNDHKQHREASKQLLLWRLPSVLIVQLKRFSFRSFIWRDKINDLVAEKIVRFSA